MRVASTASLLLLLAAVGCGVALTNCSSAPEDDDEALSDDEINGVNNKLGLGLVYDEETGTVRATMRTRLRAGEELRLRVRRGRLSIDSERALDCGELAVAPAMPREEGAFRVVYQGPQVDPSLLAPVYTEEWLQGNVSDDQIARLQMEGADSIVEACIVKNGRPRARLQTTIQYAWDEAANETGGIDTRSIQLMAPDASAPPSSGRPRIGRPQQSMEKYAELCVAELGEIPFFKKLGTGKYETFDCRDFVGANGEKIPGVESAAIPQTVTSASGQDKTPRECDERNNGRYNCFKTCDKPEWLFQSCEPGPTVHSAKNDKGTHWVLLCRSTGKRGENENVEALSKTKVFNDIAMIGHNPVTGKSCFFQNKIWQGNDGSRVTHPADVQKSRHIWDQPKGYCMGCHSAEAFIHSPWIDGAKRANGSPIVPMMGKHPDFEISWNASPFNVVNRKAQADAMVGGGSWPVPKQLVSEEADACLTCHRMGGGQGMKRFPMWAVGEEGLDRTPQGTSGPLQPKLSEWGKKFENSHWMPLRLDGLTAENWGQSKYAAAVAHIKKCAQNNADPACQWADVPEKP